MKRKYFSIIIVTLNCGNSFNETVQSILSQNFNDYEIIVVDGGSDTLTLNIIEKYFKYFSYFVSEPDNGIYDAMNKGIQVSNGEYIYFLNSGDSFNSNLILFEIFNNTNRSIKNNSKIDLVYGDIILSDQAGVIKFPRKLSRRFFFNNTICHQSVFYNRSLFTNDIKYDTNYKVIADRVNLYLLYNKNLKYKKLDLVVCLWQPVGFSAANKAIMKIEESIFQKKYYNIFERSIYKILIKFKRILK